MFDNGSFVSGLPENAVQPVTKVNDSPERGTRGADHHRMSFVMVIKLNCNGPSEYN